MRIRHSTNDDVPHLMEIYREARQIQLDSGNLHQWAEGFPSEALVRSDVDRGVGYVIEDGGLIVGAFAFVPGADPTYARIEGGGWIDDDQPYMTIHRIGSTRASRGVAKVCFEWCWEHAAEILAGFSGRPAVANVRVDTHEDNATMRHCIEKAGFRYCGVIHLLNGDPRLAFQKI